MITRRALLALPFVVPLTQALGIPVPKPRPAWLNAIGCPQGWEPYHINGQVFFPVFSQSGTVTDLVAIPIQRGNTRTLLRVEMSKLFRVFGPIWPELSTDQKQEYHSDGTPRR